MQKLWQPVAVAIESLTFGDGAEPRCGKEVALFQEVGSSVTFLQLGHVFHVL